MTAISGPTAFIAPGAAQAAQASEHTADHSAFRAVFHDATRPRGQATHHARGGSDANRGDTRTAEAAQAAPDAAPAHAASTDDAQTIAAQQAAIAQALAITGTPAAQTPATAMLTHAADAKPGELGHTPTGKAAATPTPIAPTQTTAAWLLGMPGATVAAAHPSAGKPSALATARTTATAAATATIASSAGTLASRLEAALGRNAHTNAHPGHAAPTAAAHAAASKAADAAAALSSAADPAAATALTPLEQSVHDMISELSDDRAGRGHAKLGDDDDPTAATTTTAADPTIDPSLLAAPTATPTAITAPSRTAEADPTRAASLAQPPELPSNPSHVHLVLDDGPERVVMTVAVRGNDIHVALRSSDDATTNALARNAASLDHAMRARGLQLTELTTERDPPRDHAQNRPSPDDEPRQQPRNAKPDAERFSLEEIR